MNKALFLDNLVGVLGLFVLSTISVASVVTLNPSVVGSSGAVAGLVTDQNEPTNSVIGTLINIPPEIKYEEFDNIFTFQFDNINSLKSFDFVSFTNFTKSKGIVRVEAQYPKNLEKYLRIELVDSVDRIILTSPVLGNNQRKVTVQPQSKRDFVLEISSEENINFPVEVIIKIVQ
ncbi:MAG: hypothetical protein KatS3mg086_196 [Candidatus Dojkabacteria bacterium]|nr:MAG: hypothetical protein KatS3mg086_196 [Candidatus Dojkabacteria bacterium]